MNLYWVSTRNRQHSLEIVDDSRVAVTVVKDMARKQALQIVGHAFEVDKDDFDSAHMSYTAKFGLNPFTVESMAERPPTGPAYWVLRPTTISLWDEVNFPGEPKQVYTVA